MIRRLLTLLAILTMGLLATGLAEAQAPAANQPLQRTGRRHGRRGAILICRELGRATARAAFRGIALNSSAQERS
jgi:hypothetical protein